MRQGFIPIKYQKLFQASDKKFVYRIAEMKRFIHYEI